MKQKNTNGIPISGGQAMTSVGQNTKPRAKWCQPQRSQLNQNHKPETTSKNNFHFVLENAALEYCNKNTKKKINKNNI